jgi:hypothetical protein
MGCVVAYVRIHSSLLALLRRPQRDFIPPPLPRSRRWYHRLCHPVWRKSSLTFGTDQEFAQVWFHPVFRRVATC